MSMFRIPAYDTTVINDGFIDVSVRDWQPLSIRAYILMRKSLALADRLEKRDPQGIEPKHRRKAAAKLKQAGATRWITIHPPDGDKGRPGVPVMIRENGDGTAHVVGGAGGRLNMLKLRGIVGLGRFGQRFGHRKTTAPSANAAAVVQPSEGPPPAGGVPLVWSFLARSKPTCSASARLSRSASSAFLRSSSDIAAFLIASISLANSPTFLFWPSRSRLSNSISASRAFNSSASCCSRSEGS